MADNNPIPTDIQPGQQTAIPASNYDVNKDLGRVTDRTNIVDAPTAPNLLFGGGPLAGNGQSKVNSVYGAYLGALRNTPTNFLTTPKYTNKSVADPFLTDAYGGFNPEDKNIANWYGENQSWFKQMGNRIGKLALTTVGSFANSLMDVPNMINAVHEGNIDKVWDNPVNSWATDLQNWAENKLPNYETNWEREHPFLNLIPFYGNAGNGWGNVLQQVGFTIGAIGGSLVEDAAVGALTGGAGEVPLAAMQINKAVYKFGKMVNLGEDALGGLKKSIKSADDIISGLKGVDRFNYAVRKGLWGANMITSGASEAAFEGLDGFNQLNKDLTQEYFNTTGKMPDYDAQTKIDKTARDAGNTRFLLNVGLLAATNSIQWGSLLKPFNVAKDAIEAEAKSGIKVALKEGSRDVFEAIQPTSKLARIGRAIDNNIVTTLLKDSASEGFEEGSQFAIQTGVNDYYQRKYHQPSIDQTNNFLKSFGTGLSKTLGSQEGWENIVFGVLGGAMYAGGEHAYYKLRGLETPSYKKQVDDVVAGLNTNTLSGIFENKYGEQVAADAIQDDMLNAAKHNNVFLYKNYQHEQMVNYVLSGIRQNKYETRLDQLNELNKLSGEDFKQTFGIPDTVDNQKTVTQYVESLKGTAEYIKQVHDRVDRTFINPFDYKGTGNYKNAEQKSKQDIENEKYIAFSDAKDQLTYSMTVARDSNRRTEQMKSEMVHPGIDKEEIVKLSSDKGLKSLKKEYQDQAKLAMDSFTLTKDKSTEKELNKYRNRISQIDEALDEKDPANAQKAYNGLLNDVFDGYQQTMNFLTNEPGNKFDRSIQKEYMDKAKDISYLGRRTEIAIDHYARLTTKGGFKSLFDNIVSLRKEVQSRQVPLTPETLQPQNAQVENTAKAAAAQNGLPTGSALAASQQQNGAVNTAQGELNESTSTLTPEQQKQYAQAVVNVVSGKAKSPSDELDLVDEFSTIDDLKMANPKVDLTQYTKVKSSDGKNYYILNDKVKEFQLKAGAVANPVATTPPPAGPNIPQGNGSGRSPMRTQDYMNKIFVPEDLKAPFQEAILSGIPTEVQDNMSIKITPLSTDEQTAWAEQRKNKSYTEVKGYPGVFVSKAPINLSILHEGNEIGKLTTPDRLLFKVNDQLLTIDKITPEQYSILTSQPAAVHGSEVAQYNQMVALKNYLAQEFKNNDYKETTISPEELKKLIGVSMTYGQLDLVPSGGTRPNFSALQNTTLTLPTTDKKGSPSKLILSIPKVYSNDIAAFTKTDHMNFIYNQSYYDNADNIDVRGIEARIASQISKVQDVGSRYVGVARTPDGNYSFVALRPAEISTEDKNSLFDNLKDRAAKSAAANFAETTEDQADGFLLIGDQKVYYKLPNADAKKYNDEFNTGINNSIFVSDPNGRAFFELSVSPIGAIRMEVFDRYTRQNNTLYIAPQRVEGLKSFDDIVSIFNKEAEKRAKTNDAFRNLGIQFNSNNFRQNIADDSKVTVDDIENSLSAATTSQVFRGGTMRITPNQKAVDAAFAKARGVQQNAAANQIAGQKEIDPQAAMVRETIAPSPITATGGIFGGIQQIQTDDQGNPVPVSTQDVKDVVSQEPVNQESNEDKSYTTVKDALQSVGIRYNSDNGNISFIDLASGEVLDQLAGISPTELAKQMGLDVQTVKKESPDAGFDFKLGENGVPQLNRILNVEKARQYIADNLPSFIKVEDVNAILDKIAVDGEVWGAFSNGTIYLNENAAEGTQYHEAFHAVFRMLLNDQQISDYLKEGQTGLYDQLKKEGKSINQLLSEKRALGLYTDLTPAEARDRLYEEHMADKFAAWKDNKAAAGVFSKLFDHIRKFFKWLLRSKKDLDFLFNQIDTGVYRYTNIASNRFTNNMLDEYTNPDIALSLIPARPGVMQVGKGQITLKRNLDSKTSKQTVQNVASYFNTYRLLEKYNGISDEKLLDTILDDLGALYSTDNPLYAGYTEDQMNRLASSDLAYIYKNQESRDTIKKGAIDYVNTINYIEQFRDEDQEDSEQDKGQPSTGYDNTAENVGGFSSLPGLLRQYIGFTSYEKIDEFGNKQVVEGVPVVATVDSIAVYYGMMRSLANITDPVKFFQRMILFGNGNEQSRHFVDRFIKDTGLNVEALMEENRLEATENPTLVEMVKKGFNKFRIDYLFTEQDTKKQNAKSYHANRKNVENTQFDKWSNQYANDYANYSEDGQKNIRTAIDNIRSSYFDERKNIKYDGQRLADAVTKTQLALRSVGVQLSSEYVKYSLLAANAKKYDTANESYKKEGVDLQFDDPSNKYITKQDYDYVQIMKTSDETTLTPDVLEQLSKLLASGSNPYHKDIKEVEVVDENTKEVTSVHDEIDTAMIGRLLNIAKGNALFDETVGESSYTNAEDKVVYAHQDGTFNVKFSYQLRDADYRKQLRELGYREATSAYRDAYDSEWLTNNFLLNSSDFEAVADNLLFQRIDGMRAVETNKLGKVITQEFRDQKEGITYGHYSPREFLVNFMNVYVSYAQNQRTEKGSVVTTPHLIRVLEASKTGDTVNLPILSDLYKGGTVTEKTKNLLLAEVKKEYNRITRVATEVGSLKENLVENYHTGSFAEDGVTVTKGYRGLQFTDNTNVLVPKATLTRLELQARNGEAMTKEDELEIKNQIEASLNDNVNKTLEILVREGLVNKNNKGDYTNVFLHNDYFKGNDSLNLGPRFKENVGHVLMNNYINTLAYNQILHGDSALSLKNDGGIDAVKRAKGDNAAIVSIRTDLINPELGITQPFTHSNVAIFKEPVSADGTKVADAQMYTTVEGLRYTLWGLSKLTPRLARVLDALAAGEDIHKLKGADGKAYDAIFDKDSGLLKWDEMTNSLKLVYKDGKSYFKMSVVVLQPSLTSYTNKEGKSQAIPGWETLHNLRTQMESAQIHFAAPESASKMMTMDVAKNKNFSDLVGHPYDNTYFGLQTANPSNKLTITTPTQLLQLIDSEQANETEVSINGKTSTVGQIKNDYQNYVSQKVSNDFNAARNEIYDIKDFDKDIEESISKGEVTPRLANFQRRAVSTLETTGADAQLIDFFSLDANGVPKYNLNMSSTKTKFQQLYLAYFSKGVLSQKNPGYTAALFSGIDTKTIRRATRIENGVVTAWDHVRREHFLSNIGGVQNEHLLSSPDQVTEEGQLYLDELRHNVVEYGEDGQPTGNLYSEFMLPAHYKEFLDIPADQQIPDAIAKGFGVRIPSQDKHSFMSLKMIDFLPTNLGSTGMFAKDIVRLSGADFDIDKEYISRYDFYTEYNNGEPQFRKYGEARSDEAKWYEYKKWMASNNKTLKGLINEIANTPQNSQDEISDTTLKGSDTKYSDKNVEAALKQIGLPSTLEEFIKESESKELNNGVLNNNIVDSYISLLTNKGMREIANTAATLDVLANIQKNEDVTLRDKQGNVMGTVFGKKTGFPVDSIAGQYYGFKNNTTGKDNIGIDVNANLIYSILNKGGVTIRESEEVQPFRFDGTTFNTFGGENEFNPNSKQFDGTRTNDILSTLISSATDEAKEQLNALYNLSVDALKTVNYMVGLKVPLKTAIYMVNQPAIRNYLDIKSTKANNLQTPAEEKLFRDDFRDEALNKLESDIQDYKNLFDDDLFNTLQQNGMVELKCD